MKKVLFLLIVTLLLNVTTIGQSKSVYRITAKSEDSSTIFSILPFNYVSLKKGDTIYVRQQDYKKMFEPDTAIKKINPVYFVNPKKYTEVRPKIYLTYRDPEIIKIKNKDTGEIMKIKMKYQKYLIISIKKI